MTDLPCESAPQSIRERVGIDLRGGLVEQHDGPPRREGRREQDELTLPHGQVAAARGTSASAPMGNSVTAREAGVLGDVERRLERHASAAPEEESPKCRGTSLF